MKKLITAGAAAVLALGLGTSLASAQTATTSTSTATQPSTPGTVPPAGAANQAAKEANNGPQAGANSFTEGQAQARIADAGFTSVANLKKDNDGVWHGTAMKNGQQVNVWLDYTGHVGQS